MKKYKIVFLILILILLSGCTFEYNVNVNDGFISEDNTVYIDGVTPDTIEDTFVNIVHKYTGFTDSLGMYSSSVIDKNDLIGISYKNDYGFYDYNYSVSFSACYDNYKLIQDEYKLIIATGKEFNCFDKYEELDEVVVNLTTDYYVEKSNADVVDGNKYTWYINKNTASDENINVTIDLTKPIYKNKLSWFNVFSFVIIFFVIIGFVILLISLRSKKKNKI